MRVPINDTAPQTGNSDVEKFEELKADTGEVVRFMIPVPEATACFVHELKPVLFNPDGTIQKDKKQRRSDKSWYEVDALGFKGRKVCTGLEGPMLDKGVDPENCIICKACIEHGIAQLRAELRYAVPILRIATQSKTSAEVIADPPVVKALVLPLTARQYSDLTKSLGGIRAIYDWGPEHPVAPNQADLAFEVEDGDFKRYKWLPPMRPLWAKSADGTYKNKELAIAIARTWRNEANRPTEAQLVASCGKQGDLVFLQQDLDETVESHARAKAVKNGQIQGTRPGVSDRGPEADLSAGLDELDVDSILGGGPVPDAAAPAAAPDGLSGLDEFLPEAGKPSNGHSPEAGDDLLGLDAAPAVPAAAGQPGTFDDIMGDLDVP